MCEPQLWKHDDDVAPSMAPSVISELDVEIAVLQRQFVSERFTRQVLRVLTLEHVARSGPRTAETGAWILRKICFRYFVCDEFNIRRGTEFRVAAGVIAVVAILLGPWLLQVWRQTGNPIFPYLNDVFHSPLTTADSHWLSSYRPQSLAEILFLPLRIAGVGRHIIEMLE